MTFQIVVNTNEWQWLMFYSLFPNKDDATTVTSLLFSAVIYVLLMYKYIIYKFQKYWINIILIPLTDPHNLLNNDSIFQIIFLNPILFGNKILFFI